MTEFLIVYFVLAWIMAIIATAIADTITDDANPLVATVAGVIIGFLWPIVIFVSLPGTKLSRLITADERKE